LFDKLTRDLVEKTTKPVEQALYDAGIAASELNHVLLVGGSTRIPAVQAHVRKLTGKEPSASINPDECVAQGAAIQSYTLSNALKVSDALATKRNEILLLDVTPLSLSIETVGGVATRIVERNTTLPIRYSQIFSTAAPFQTSVEVNVLQGERPMARDNKAIGTFRLKGIKRAPAGVPEIEVTFDIDANGILKVRAKDLDTGKEQSITITADDRMSDAEIEEAMRDAARYAAQDKTKREGVALRDEAAQLHSEVSGKLNDAGKKLGKEEKKSIKSKLDSLQKQLAKKAVDLNDQDLADLRETIRNLRDLSQAMDNL
jgi:molecular chaperone DnaK